MYFFIDYKNNTKKQTGNYIGIQWNKYNIKFTKQNNFFKLKLYSVEWDKKHAKKLEF